jgi:hypothetical protein
MASGEEVRLPNRSGRLADVTALGFLAGAIAVVFWPELTFRKAFFYFDVSSLSMPARHWGFSQIRAGEFPQWCRNWQTGFPFVAESQSGICYPPNYLFYLLVQDWKAYTLAYLSHLLLAAWGGYALFRRWTNVSGSLVGALMFALGGRLLTHQVHTSMVEAMAWFPVVLCFLDRFGATGRVREAAVAGFAAGMQILAGSLQAVVCCQCGYAAFVLAQMWLARRPSAAERVVHSPIDQRSQRGYIVGWTRVRWLAGAGLVVFVGLGIGAVLVLPALELFLQTPRAGGLAREAAGWGAFAPMLWASSFIPYLFGHLGYGCAWLEGPTPWQEMGFYYGIVAVPVAAAAAASPKRSAVLLCSVLVASGLVLAAGDLHFATRIVRALPVLSGIRVPVRFAIIAGLGLCGLVALGWEALRDPARSRRARNIVLATTIACVVFSGLTAATFYYPALAALVTGRRTGIAGIVLESPGWSRTLDMLRTQLPWSLAALSGGAAGGILVGRRPRLATAVMAITVTIDLGHWTRELYPTIDPAFHDEPASARFIKETVSPARIYVYDPPSEIAAPGFHYSTKPFDDLGECLYWERGPLFDVSLVSVFAALPLRTARWVEFHEQLIDRAHPWYNQLLGLSLVMTPKPTAGDPLAQPPVYRGQNCYVYRFRDPTPHAYFCPRAKWVPEGGALETLLRDPIDPRTQVVLEAAQPRDGGDPSSAAFAPAKTTWLGPNRFLVTLECPAAGFVVVNETWYPGWRVEDSGRHATILRANHLFMAVPVAEGAHELEFTFSSLSVRWGGWITLLSTAVLLALIFSRRRWTMHPPSELASLRPVGWLGAATLGSFAVSAMLYPADWNGTLWNVLTLIEQMSGAGR